MKFFPEEKKKVFRSLVILVIAMGGIIYFNFFLGGAADQPAPNPEVTEAAGDIPSVDRIDIRILESEDFRVLRAGPALLIRPDELGKANPFLK